MENLWLRRKVGMKQRPNNVFIVKLPPPTVELAEARRKTQEITRQDYEPEELYGAWI